jgi:hypothetical protein
MRLQLSQSNAFACIKVTPALVRKSPNALPQEDQPGESSRLAVHRLYPMQAKIEPAQIQRMGFLRSEMPVL